MMRPIVLVLTITLLALVPRMSNVVGTFRDSDVVLGGEDSYYHMRRIELAIGNRGVLPLPHPSPRNRLWLARNPWFEVELLPELRRRVREALA